MKAKLQQYFDSYPNDTCFSTADEFIFHKENDAIAYANTLEDKKVKEHDRVDYPAENVEVSAEEKKAAAEVKAAAKKAADEAAALAKKATGAKQKAAADKV